MSTPFLSEIRLMSFNFAPKGWALCNGQLLPINQNQALFSLLGTTYGGDGRVNFGLPDLRARVPMHMGNGHVLGERAGEDSHTLRLTEIPTHVHGLQASPSSGNSGIAGNNILASAAAYSASPSTLTSLTSATVASIGGSQPHANEQPYLVLSYCICLQGIFPSRS